MQREASITTARPARQLRNSRSTPGTPPRHLTRPPRAAAHGGRSGPGGPRPWVLLLAALASACAERPRQEPVPARDDEGEHRAAAPTPRAPSGLPIDPPASAPMAAGKSQRFAVGTSRDSKRLLPSGTSASEAELPAGPEPAPAELEASAATQPADRPGFFLGKPEDALLERLRSAEIESVLPDPRGRPGAFDVALADGGHARFEPERAAAKGRWSAPIAAHLLDRALGLGRVPPVVGRSLPWNKLERAAASEPEPASIVRDPQGNVRGALMYRPPGKLAEVRLPAGWDQWLSIEPLAAAHVSPYQPAAAWSAAREAARDRTRPAESPSIAARATPEPPSPDLPAELSDMMLFDYLTLDTERFAEAQSGLLALARRGPWIWLDNGTFSGGPEAREIGARRLAGVSRFRRRTLDALRALDVAALGARMRQAALGAGPLLDRKALAGLEARKRAVLAHADKQQRRFGDAVFAW